MRFHTDNNVTYANVFYDHRVNLSCVLDVILTAIQQISSSLYPINISRVHKYSIKSTKVYIKGSFDEGVVVWLCWRD